MIAALANLFFINLLAVDIGWRFGFAIGAIAAVFVLWMRRSLPESPRWQLTKGRSQEAEAAVQYIEEQANQSNGTNGAVHSIEVDYKAAQPFFRQVAELITRYPSCIALGCILDLSEAFGYYGMFAFLALVVLPAVNIPATQIPLVLFPGQCRSISWWPGHAIIH